ncbi:hypothetical protein PWT90_00100 [Aphanocladium album]|nr:hypothetical protein PWT90_00100 [Aphanocladium album]
MAKKNKTKAKGRTQNHKAAKQGQNQNLTTPLATLGNIFTLADEARQTIQHDHSFWSQETKLRSIPVSFVSAGMSEPLKTPQNTASDGKQSNPATPIRTATPNGEACETTERTAESEKPHSTSERNNEGGSLFFFDTTRAPDSGNRGNAEAPAMHTPRGALPETDKSDSDGEVILFKGRLNTTRENSDTIDMNNISKELHAVEKEICESPATTTEQKQNSQETKKNQKNKRGKRGGKQARAKRAAAHVSGGDEDEDEGLLADYIANMRANGEMLELLDTAGISEGSENETECSLDSSDGGNAEELSIERLLTMQPGKQTLNRPLGGNIMEYTDFDPMDWENPNIQRKKGKGAKQKLDLRFADIDSETERRLQATWRSDRLKKAERKRERERLRALNLLGKKADKSDTEDMRAKYPKGMNLDQIADELKEFLMSSDESICLPPMDKHARKMIHELANKFNVKSKSIGKADQRRPTLYRTKRTLRFDDAAFSLAVRRIHRRYFPRLDYKGKSGQAQASRNGFAEASYRDGEVVGASAPELSIENRGRAMLEKMGWSNGTALGSEENKGILLPVTQTMKRSKAGLG